MRWQEDTGPAAWLTERIPPWREPYTMHTVVPTGFASYARIFHSATRRTLPGGEVPSPDDFVRLSAEAQGQIASQLEEESVTWAETAGAFGTTMHASAEWYAITAAADRYVQSTHVNGAEYVAPEQGFAGAETLASIVRIALTHTTTPHDGFAAVWEGWGGLLGGFTGIGQRYAMFADGQPEPHKSFLTSLKSTLFENPYGKKTWQSGVLSDEVSRGTKLELPERNHVLFTGDIATFADPAWLGEVPWAEEQGWTRGPSLIWPADRAWVVTCDVDDDFTIVAGSVELIAALVGAADLESFEVPPGSDLKDTING